MKTILFTSALLAGLIVHSASAQFAWNEGEVTLSTGVKLWGSISHQAKTDILLVRTLDKVKTYTPDQLQGFQFIEPSTGAFRHFSVYHLTSDKYQETMPVIFEELIPGATVQLLQLSEQHNAKWLRMRELSLYQKGDWSQQKPWFIWLNGQCVAPNVFVETEMANLLAASSPSVQRWANTFPQPTNPKALARWLRYFHERANRMQNPRIERTEVISSH